MPTKINKVKKCVACGYRLSGKHHYFCDFCWEKRHKEKMQGKMREKTVLKIEYE